MFNDNKNVTEDTATFIMYQESVAYQNNVKLRIDYTSKDFVVLLCPTSIHIELHIDVTE